LVNRLLLLANVTSLEIQVTSILTPYATSAFALHSLVSTIYVVQGVVAGRSVAHGRDSSTNISQLSSSPQSARSQTYSVASKLSL
jgi:hypothetical protein